MESRQNHAQVKKNRKIKILSEKYENVMGKNEARHTVFGSLKWLVRLWKGFEIETKKLEK